MATDDLKARLRTPHSSLATQSFIMNEAAARIATLEAQLAARDAEIAAFIERKCDYWRKKAGCFGEYQAVKEIATAIERGDYRKDEA